MKNKKFELTNESIKCGKRTLYRIRAIRDFANIKSGNYGGFVENENNLSHSGNSWIYGNARVYESARVTDNAIVTDNARVYGHAKISDNAIVANNAKVHGSANVHHSAMVFERANIYGFADIGGHSTVRENARVFGNAVTIDNSIIYGVATLCGDVIISGRTEICGNAKVSNENDYIVFKTFWEYGYWCTYTFSNKMWTFGGFHGNSKKLLKTIRDSNFVDTDGEKHFEAAINFVKEIEKLRMEHKNN